ncbi:MAG: hypothetical protein K0U84_09330 [Actinomycetia bacterium]|nr:hypothetical protein [Actinomycetes bacterium]
MDLNATGTVPPKGTRLNGQAVWSAVLARYELEPHEQALLREIVRSVDDLDRLAGASSRNPVVNREGGINPALNEARQLRSVLATLVGALRLPVGPDDVQTSIRPPQPPSVVRSIHPRALPQGRHHNATDPTIQSRQISVAELRARLGDGIRLVVS